MPRAENQIVRIKCTTKLLPGQTDGYGQLLDYDPTAKVPGLTPLVEQQEGRDGPVDIDVKIVDLMHLVCLLPGEYAFARRFSDSGFYEILGPIGLLRMCKPKSAVTAGSSGTVEIYTDPSTNSMVEVDAYLDWADGGENISMSKECFIKYMTDRQEWQFVIAECEA
ncbi:MAG: hypothetical protein MJA29_06620 [Candidatus Omnitrophica bacterium]|nr:hypothetical protein [Candidatus Omnitrophota bacterium]